ncbi:uncharacterized protein LOC106709830 [Papilio machaon]|uniref:uncharacterized protein LOC106709830 n=1 Tax=Papilio machaon TaxID=76193 RepID=UPI001E665975|nr:uncharacterized protein LOC106709830 [Papilio machaon]
MITKFLQSLEDPKKPLFGPNYWMLTKTGLILPDSKKGKAIYIFLLSFLTFFVFTQYLELFNIGSNLDLVLTNLRISMLSIVCVVKANTFVFWQRKWKQLIEYITEADKYERYSRDQIRKRIIANYTKYCRKVVYFYCFLVGMTVITVTNAPLLKYLSSSIYRDALSNGTESFPHIFSSWVPFDKYSSPGCWVTVLYQASMCIYGGSIMAAYDTSVMVIMVYFGGKLDLLRERCRQIFGTDGLGVSNEEVEATMKELHSIHDLLMKNAKLFNSLLSPVMFLYVVMCSSMLCFSAFQLTTATSTTQKVLMAEYLIFGIMQLFFFCWHSNVVIVKSGNVMLGPYESEWWMADPRQRKNIILLAGQLNRVHTFTAGPFTNLTLSTFVTILKGAYSYYTLFLIAIIINIDMENQNTQEKTAPIQYVRSSRAFRQFKNPPQPHMCIQDSIRDTSEKLYINVLGWQKIANPKQYSDPIPLYGGMQVHQGCGPNSNRPPLLVFAVMVNPDILKANGKNASNPTDREALVSLLCDFVEAMNPGLILARNPVILRDRDLAGELKDVWLAVQNKREREKGMTQDVMYKVYDIDGIGSDDINEDEKSNSRSNRNYDNGSPNRNHQNDKKNTVKSSKQILLNAGQKSEFDSGMNNCQLNQNQLHKDNKTGNTDSDTTYCTPVYGQIVSSRENHNQINEIQQKFATTEPTKPSSSFRKDWNPIVGKTEGWNESKRNIIKHTDDLKKQKCSKTDKANKQISNGKHYDFFPVFDNKASDLEFDKERNAAGECLSKKLEDDNNSKIILDPMQKLVLHSTDNM